MENLEALAASAKQGHTIGKPVSPDADLSKTVTTEVLFSTTTDIASQNLPASTVAEFSVLDSSEAILEDLQYHVPPADGIPFPSVLTKWDSVTHIDPSLLIHDKQSHGLSQAWMTTVNCCCSKPHVQIQTQGLDLLSPGEIKILSFGDPYANSNLRIETICNIAALYTLGNYIGVTEELLCTETSLSPFFRPTATSADEIVKSNIISTIQGIFKTLKPDLRPSREQITVNHHPYIDILPFPILRKNLIVHQEEIDEDEFFHDMLTGLICWGGSGVGRRDRKDSTGYASTGTPWDVRSWEAKEWFLKKYWTLLGGEDGELVRQSEWWRGIRGEDDIFN